MLVEEGSTDDVDEVVVDDVDEVVEVVLSDSVAVVENGSETPVVRKGGTGGLVVLDVWDDDDVSVWSGGNNQVSQSSEFSDEEVSLGGSKRPRLR